MSDKISSILNILKSKDFSELIGIEEDLYFEAKGKNPYNLDSPNGRYELAKDVSAFANSEGGIVVIGLITEIVTDKRTEKIKDIDLLSQSEFEISKYEGIILETIFPKIIRIEINWVKDFKNSEKGIAYILIPKQDSDKKYFLIKNLIEEKTDVKGIVFGIAQRIESSSQPLSIDQLHQKIQYGMNSTAEKLFRIEEKINFLNENLIKNSTESPVTKISERINRIIENKE